MKTFKKLEVVFDRILDVLAIVAAGLVALLLIGVNIQVFFNNVLNRPIVWVIEVAQYCIVFITFLGAPWILRNKKHIAMDLLTERMKPRIQKNMQFIISIICAIVCIVMTWYGVAVSLDYYLINFIFSDSDAIRVPAFIIVAVIPLSFGLMVIEFLRHAYSYFKNK